MELATQQVILKPDFVKASKYALPAAKITAVNPTPDRPLGSFVANVNADARLSWRMVYDDKQIRDLFQSDGFTYTIFNLFCAETKDDCVAQAAKLGLPVPEDPLEKQIAAAPSVLKL